MIDDAVLYVRRFIRPIWLLSISIVPVLSLSPGIADMNEESSNEASAPVATTSFAFETSVITSYLWRGINYHDDLFEPAVQSFFQLTRTRLGPGDIRVGIWHSLPVREQRSITPEIDPYVMYTIGHGHTSLELLYWIFMYPGQTPVDAVHAVQGQLSHVDNEAGVTHRLGVTVDPIRTKRVYAYWILDISRSVGAWSIGSSIRWGVSRSPTTALRVQDLTASLSVIRRIHAHAYLSATAIVAYSGLAHSSNERILPAASVAFGFSY